MGTRVELARIISSHGVHGGIKAISLCEKPERLTRSREAWLVLAQGSAKRVALKSASINGKGFILQIEGIDSPEQVRPLAGAVLALDREEIEAEPGETLVCDMKDLEVVDEAGSLLGRLVGVYSTGAQDVYEIASPEGGETWLIPAIPQVVLAIDTKAGRMTVRLMPGLGPGLEKP